MCAAPSSTTKDGTVYTLTKNALVRSGLDASAKYTRLPDLNGDALIPREVLQLVLMQAVKGRNLKDTIDHSHRVGGLTPRRKSSLVLIRYKITKWKRGTRGKLSTLFARKAFAYLNCANRNA